MKVKNYLSNLFETMESKKPNQDIFNFVDSKLIDKYYINLFGNRDVAEIVINLDIEEIAEILNNMFLSKWNNIIINYLDSENMLDNYKEVLTEINNDVINNETNRTNTNKVSAYNDDDFINNDEDISIETTNIENDRNKEIIKTKIKETDFYIKVNNYLTNFNIYNIMILDINSVVTLNILN